MTKPRSPWFVRRTGQEPPSLRLFCLPHAGAGAAMYHEWLSGMPASIEVCAVEPPGKLSRHRELAPSTITGLVEELDHAAEGLLDLPFAVFGYSLGATLAFEWCRRLRRNHDLLPAQLIVAVSNPPQLARLRTKISHLPRAEFKRTLEATYGELDPRITDPALLDLIFRILQADLTLLESYEFSHERPLHCPITAIGGEADQSVSFDNLRAWSAHTSASFEAVAFAGGHFFIREHGRALRELVARTLTSSQHARRHAQPASLD